MTWMIILSLNIAVTPLIETKMFYTQGECEVYGNMKRMRDDRYGYWCTDLKGSK